MTIVIDPEVAAALPTVDPWTRAPLERDRRFFSVDFDCVSYTVVARDHAHVHELMETICKTMDYERSYAEMRAADGDPTIEEIDGNRLIWDDGRDGKQHPINTYPLGTWASSEY